MRVLIGSNTPNDMRLGVSIVIHQIGCEFSRMGHSVDYLYAEDVPKYIPYGRLPALNYSLAAVQIIREREQVAGPYDIVNIHGGDGCFYGLYKKMFGRPGRFAVTIHGSEEFYWDQWRQEARLGLAPKIPFRAYLAFRLLRLTQIRLALQTSDRILCASFKADKEHIVSKYGIARDRITVVPNGVGEEYFITRDYEREPPRLLMVSTWLWRKGVKYLARAFERVYEKYPEVQLSLLCTWFGVEKVRSEFPVYLQQKIKVEPFVPVEEVLSEYQRHDIFVLPSLVEGMPLALLRAMATGMPVVVTNTCSMHDLVESGYDGLLVPCRDSEALARAISTLIQDKTLREKLGTNAQMKMRDYTWEKVASAWWAAMMNGR